MTIPDSGAAVVGGIRAGGDGGGARAGEGGSGKGTTTKVAVTPVAAAAATSRTPLVAGQSAEARAGYGGHGERGERGARGGHDGDFVTENEDRDLARGLEQRHVSLIAIAGAVGTGLFLGLGSAVRTAGPLGALLGYATVGLIVCAVQFALGEVTALLPVTGSFVRHAEFLVDPALGFAIGWNIVSGKTLSLSPASNPPQDT